MVQFDNQYRQIKVKIVYYGPALGGKTSSLQHIHKQMDPGRRTRLYSLNTANDRTLFFDLLGLDLGRVKGYDLVMQLFTVPGQVHYNTTRRAVLAGTDGVVLVASSAPKQREANTDSLRNLHSNLRHNGIDPLKVPLVFQLNKRDLPQTMSVEEMTAALAPGGGELFPTVALTGEGIFESFIAITELTLVAVAGKLGLGDKPKAIARLQERARKILEPFVATSSSGFAGLSQAPVSEPAEQEPDVETPMLDQDTLVAEAVRANLAMADLNARLDALGRMVEHKAAALGGIAQITAILSRSTDPEAIPARMLDAAVGLLDADCGSVLLLGDGPRAAAIQGFEHDPLLGTLGPSGDLLASEIASCGRPVLISDDPTAEMNSAMEVLEDVDLGSAIVAPLGGGDRAQGALALYRRVPRRAFASDDLDLLGTLASSGGIALERAWATVELEHLNRSLEDKVNERTSELQSALEEQQRLSAMLKTSNEELDLAYKELSGLDATKGELISRIAEQLRGPVTGLLTAARLLARGGDEERGKRLVDVVNKEAARLQRTVDGVVQASALASSDKPVSRRKVGVADLFKAALAPLRDLAEDRQVVLNVRANSTMSSLDVDPESMPAALRAVVANAIQHSPRGGQVEIAIGMENGVDGEILRIAVSDHGSGIPESEQGRIFEPFYQGATAMAAETASGIGLGLAITKRVVEGHGGRVELRSRVGDGSTFTLLIPES